MDIKILSNQLSKIYNSLGNKWLVENFVTEPFEMRIYVRKGTDADDLHDYEVEIYTDRKVPGTFEYRKDVMAGVYGAHISYIKTFFKELATYVEPSFGKFGKTIGINFMDIQPKV